MSQVGRPPPTIDWSLEVTSEQPLPYTIRRERGSFNDATVTGLCIHTDDGPTIYLDPIGLPVEQMTIDNLPGLAAHEMGHCTLGLKDDPQTDGIMRVTTPMRWTEREQEQCKTSSLCEGTTASATSEPSP